MRKPLYMLAGIAAFILLAAALPYFGIIEVHPILGWLIGGMLTFVLPVLLIALVVICIKEIIRKPPLEEEILDLGDFPSNKDKRVEPQQITDDNQYL
jgi:hypothetical protein